MEQLLDINEVCNKLKVKPKTVYDWVYSKRIPFIKVGKLLRFEEEMIQKWLQENTHLPGCLKIKKI